jgi:hypothetical protein
MLSFMRFWKKKSQYRVVLAGTRPEASRAMSYLARNRMACVGVWSSDPEVRNRLFHGVNVTGGKYGLHSLASELQPDEIMVTDPDPDDEWMLEVFRLAEEVGCGVTYWSENPLVAGEGVCFQPVQVLMEKG